MIEGSCLCGEVSYTLESDLLFLYHCHCVECRKFSGSSNAPQPEALYGLYKLIVAVSTPLNSPAQNWSSQP